MRNITKDERERALEDARAMIEQDALGFWNECAPVAKALISTTEENERLFKENARLAALVIEKAALLGEYDDAQAQRIEKLKAALREISDLCALEEPKAAFLARAALTGDKEGK